MNYSKARDQRIADEASAEADKWRNLMCAVHGCPNRWSVDFCNGMLCSWHDRAQLHRWPQVTEEQLDAQADRAMRSMLPQRPASPVDKRAVLAQLADLAHGMRQSKPSRQWAYDLQDRQRNSFRLTPTQRDMMEDVLRYDPGMPAKAL
jgi:hypothetical protein